MMNLAVNNSGNLLTSAKNGAVEEESPNVLAISLILSFVMAFTLFGNSLVLLAFYAQPSLRKVMYFPIISLALADLLCAVTAMLLYIVKKNTSVHDADGINERLVCDLYRFSYFFTEYASIMSLTAISIERFLIIHNPLKYRSFISSRIMITSLILCWVEALFVSTMPFYWRSNRKENCTNSPTANWSLMVITVNVFVPFLLILSCYCYVYIKTLGEFNKDTAQHHDLERDLLRVEYWKIERKATISFTVVIGVFVVCWGPSTIYYFLANLCPECFAASFKRFKAISSASMKILTFCNSFMNPIIYFWLNIDFRNAFKRVLRREWLNTVQSRSRSATMISLQPGVIEATTAILLQVRKESQDGEIETRKLDTEYEDTIESRL